MKKDRVLLYQQVWNHYVRIHLIIKVDKVQATVTPQENQNVDENEVVDETKTVKPPPTKKKKQTKKNLRAYYN